MNKFLKYTFVTSSCFFAVSSYASNLCPNAIVHEVKTETKDGEPTSKLSITYNHKSHEFNLPFIASYSACEIIDSDNVIKLTVPSERPRLERVFYFHKRKNIDYIGSISISTSSGEERVNGISDIEKGVASLNPNSLSIKGEDIAILSHITNIAYRPQKKSVINALYSDMRFIEIDTLSQRERTKICDDDSRVFFYCKTKSEKNLNLCYNPLSGNITYNYGKRISEISLNMTSFEDQAFNFDNKNTRYSVSPTSGMIEVTQNNILLTKMQCK